MTPAMYEKKCNRDLPIVFEAQPQWPLSESSSTRDGYTTPWLDSVAVSRFQ